MLSIQIVKEKGGRFTSETTAGEIKSMRQIFLTRSTHYHNTYTPNHISAFHDRCPGEIAAALSVDFLVVRYPLVFPPPYLIADLYVPERRCQV